LGVPVLVLDTSTPAVTAAVVDVAPGGTTVLAERVTVDGRAHGELLAPQVAAVLDEAGVRPDQLTAIVAGLGPGPFTGLRVGLVTAVAFAHALGLPGYGVCSLDAFAYGTTGRLLVATDARRKEVYWAEYADGIRLAGPEVVAPGEVHTRATLAVGDGAVRYQDVLGLSVDGPRYPPAGALAALAADRILAGAPGEALVPLYLRRPDAALPGERKPALRG
jgi:tRNA threonylcarbamoyl adenosine modification protein YeaZ